MMAQFSLAVRMIWFCLATIGLFQVLLVERFRIKYLACCSIVAAAVAGTSAATTVIDAVAGILVERWRNTPEEWIYTIQVTGAEIISTRWRATG